MISSQDNILNRKIKYRREPDRLQKWPSNRRRRLRRHLGAAYKPAKHLGGAIYFFLRGIEGPTRGCYVVPAEPKLLDGIDALLRKTSP